MRFQISGYSGATLTLPPAANSLAPGQIEALTQSTLATASDAQQFAKSAIAATQAERGQALTGQNATRALQVLTDAGSTTTSAQISEMLDDLYDIARDHQASQTAAAVLQVKNRTVSAGETSAASAESEKSWWVVGTVVVVAAGVGAYLLWAKGREGL